MEKSDLLWGSQLGTVDPKSEPKSGGGRVKMGKVSQLYGDRWKGDFWSCVYRS